MASFRPYVTIFKYLANKGYRVSFISTPRNIKRLPKIPTNLAPLLNFVELTLPNDDHNLPAEAEATSDILLDKAGYLKKAFDGLESPLAHFLEILSYPADWIIYDFAPHWLPPIAAKLGIPCVYFSIFNATCLSYLAAPSLRELDEDASKNPYEGLSIRPKWIPFEFDNNFVLRMYEIKKLMKFDQANVSGVEDRFRGASIMQGCEVVAVRSCPEIETEWLSLLQDEIHKKTVIPIGLLPPPHVNLQEDDEMWAPIKEWLDKKETKNVIYVALGSEVILSQEETTELALGLESSELPFFWVLRAPVGSTEYELPTGFEDRVKGRGFICKSWAPQLKILSHPSVGAFLTHCGWSSVIESLGIGCPIVLLPFINDQGIMARMLQLKNIAFEIPRNNMDGSFTRESVAKSLRKLVIEKVILSR
ncbi:Udp-glycosyltransferase [Thalictrum thalictroides]|uniref:Glycosyltransferase n=1 Tax=Thalictrum thalictroides TaxID=46969 RepID=A0A7J6WCU8_THATH|nr:Udp-glycosyltransferase [Thalictrum thalictroides]